MGVGRGAELSLKDRCHRHPGDMCRFGMKIDDQLVRKQFGVATNSTEIAAELDLSCECPTKRHAMVQGAATKQLATYPKKFSQAILRGLRKQLQRDGVYFADVAEEVEELSRYKCLQEFYPTGLPSIAEIDREPEQDADEMERRCTASST